MPAPSAASIAAEFAAPAPETLTDLESLGAQIALQQAAKRDGRAIPVIIRPRSQPTKTVAQQAAELKIAEETAAAKAAEDAAAAAPEKTSEETADEEAPAAETPEAKEDHEAAEAVAQVKPSDTVQAQLDAVLAENAALKATLAAKDTAEPVKIAYDAKAPLADCLTHEQLEARLKWAEDVQALRDTNPDAETFKDANGNDVRFADAMPQVRAINRSTPSRLLFIQKFQANKIQAEREFPSLYDPKSPDYAAREQLVKSYPELLMRDDSPLVVAQIIEGRKSAAARAGKPAKPVIPAAQRRQAPRVGGILEGSAAPSSRPAASKTKGGKADLVAAWAAAGTDKAAQARAIAMAMGD